jgi:hypothetical protein
MRRSTQFGNSIFQHTLNAIQLNKSICIPHCMYCPPIYQETLNSEDLDGIGSESRIKCRFGRIATAVFIIFWTQYANNIRSSLAPTILNQLLGSEQAELIRSTYHPSITPTSTPFVTVYHLTRPRGEVDSRVADMSESDMSERVSSLSEILM